MKGNRLIGIAIGIAFGVFFGGCDTSRTVDSPLKNYFVKYYGHDGFQTGVDVAVNPDGTYILLGTTKRPGDLYSQLYLVKADVYGNVLWEKTMGRSLNEEARDVELTSDGRIIVLGNSYVSETSRDIFLMLCTADGDSINGITLGLTTNPGGLDADDDVASVTETTDGFIVCGTSDHVDNGVGNKIDLKDAIHVRFNTDLTPYPNKWRNAHGGGDVNAGTKIFQLADGSFCFFGFSNNARGNEPINFNFAISPMDVDGEITAGTLTPGSLGDDRLGSVSQISTPAGPVFFMAGVATSTDGIGSSLYVSRTNIKASDIEQGFQNLLPEPLNTPGESKTSVSASASGGFYTLTNDKTSGNYNLLLTKFDDQGLKAWTSNVIYGGAGNDFSGSVTELPDGKLIISGTMAIGADGETKMVMMKVNKNGQFAD
jgi:hypothetical protein